MSETSERAARIVARCDELRAITEEPGKLTRRYGSGALRETQEIVASWMGAAGLEVRRDAVGNLFGRWEGTGQIAQTLLLGSHLDSVRDAGNYDGPLGVMTSLAVVERLSAEGRRLPFAVEIVAFADEEGVRFQTDFLGSSAIAGRFDPAWLDRTDPNGETLAAAMRAFGGDPTQIASADRSGESFVGYAEVHIEQGPTLEALDLPVGVVTGIVGFNRAEVTIAGEAGHAGTLTMERRRDALCAAAEAILAIEKTARAHPGLVGTVGQLSVTPNASNVVPGVVTFSVDMRHADDDVRARGVAEARRRVEAIGPSRGVSVDWHEFYDRPAAPCDPDLSATLAAAVEAAGYPAHRLPSGAGHDPAALVRLCPTAMLFVRCERGISHNPAEAVAIADVAVALDVMERFVASLAGQHAHAA